MSMKKRQTDGVVLLDSLFLSAKKNEICLLSRKAG